MAEIRNRVKFYLTTTTLHGLRYIADKNRHPIIRLLWMVVFVTSTSLMFKIFYGSYQSFKYNSISFVTETTYLEWNTTFPAVTICEITSTEIFWTPEPGEDYSPVQQFISDIIFFTGSCYSCSTPCEVCEEFNFREIAKRYRRDCRSIMKNCKWDDVSFDCCEKFLPLDTEYGICFSINSLHTSKTPRSEINMKSNRETGPGQLFIETVDDVRRHRMDIVMCQASDILEKHCESGKCQTSKVANSSQLGAVCGCGPTFPAIKNTCAKANYIEDKMFVVNYEDTTRCTCARNGHMYFHAPEDVPFINSNSDQRKDVALGEIYNVTINIIEIANDDGIKDLSVDKRGCRFPWEKTEEMRVHELYSYSTCVVQCHADAHNSLCNCTHHLMPVLSEEKFCDMDGLQCLTDNFEILNRLHAKGFIKPGLVCDCVPSCVEPEYNIVAERRGVRTGNSEIVIKLQSLPTFRFKRNVVRSTMDLVVSIGGTAGLFIGASLLSIIETPYLLFLRR